MTHPRSRPRDDPAVSGRAKLSAFVIAYNRQAIIGTCLKALAFADELIVIDKGSTDATAAIASTLADRVISVPWTPTVEETRDFAAAQCAHDWVLFLDDDECLSPEAVRFIDAELAAPRADIYLLPQRHYIMGRHDERAYYWPEYQIRCFRRGAVTFTDRVHGGTRLLSDHVHSITPEDGVCIHHLSHRDVAHFIDKANRYTSQPDRVRDMQAGTGIARFAHERIDHWVGLSDACAPDGYPIAVAVLRAVYDLIDRLKTWEEEALLDGAALFRAECARLETAYETDLRDLARPRTGSGAIETVPPGPPAPPTPGEDMALVRRAMVALHDSVQAQRDAVNAARTDLEAARLRETEQRERAAAMQRWAESSDGRANDFESKLGAFSRHHDATLAEHAAAAARLAATHEAERRVWEAERTSWQAGQAIWDADRSAWEAERTVWAGEQSSWRTERLSWQAERAATDAARGAWQAERAAWEVERSERGAGLTALAAALATATARAEAAEHRYRSIETSTCWRITRPLRTLLMRLGRR